MFVDIRSKKELLTNREKIFQLFNESFGKSLSLKDWSWFYIDNPIGDPYVSLFFDEGRLLGHYAVLPTLLTYRGNSFIGYRSMTTMVHPDGRGKKLFTELARRVYLMLESDGAALVYGFPNANSAPGFLRNLGWTLLPPDRICDLTGKEIIENELIQAALINDADIEWNSLDTEQAKWRCAIPGFSVEVSKGLIIKKYNDVCNILHMDTHGFEKLDSNTRYRTLIPSDFTEITHGLNSVFDYQFGFKFFDEKYIGSKFRRELIMSDIF